MYNIFIVHPDGTHFLSLPFSDNFSEIDSLYGGICTITGHSGRTVGRMLSKVIDRLLEVGVSEAEAKGDGIPHPDKDNVDWSWGIKNGEFMPEDEFRKVYLWHLVTIRDFAELFHGCRFFTSRIFPVKPFLSESGEESEGEDVDGDVG